MSMTDGRTADLSAWAVSVSASARTGTWQAGEAQMCMSLVY